MIDKAVIPKREGFDSWVFVDGVFSAELSDELPSSAEIDGSSLSWTIPAGIELDKPVHMLQITTKREQPPVNFSIRLQEKSKATFWFENWCAEQEGSVSVVQKNRVQLDAGAVCHWVTCQREFGVQRSVDTQWQQAGSSQLEWFYLGLAADDTCENTHVQLQGEQTHTRLRGLLFPAQKQKMALYTLLSHEKPHSCAQQVFRCVAADRGLAELEGRVLVQPGADKTVSTQSYKSILLSNEAQAKTRPQLEIYADDVICNHGASIGELEEKQLFYLRSRGIELVEARRLLLHGFAQALIHEVKDEILRAELLTTLENDWKETES
jgi:Fe-S cluster assembly protein SufD